MTKTTEDLKREMYDRLSALTEREEGSCLFMARNLEEALEEYLEALRQESVAKDVRIDHLERMGDVMRDGYMYQQKLTAQARNEAGSERNRRQAFEFANQSAGEFLQEARAKVKTQRQSIGKLKNERDNAVHTLKVKTSKLEKALQELQELRKSQEAIHGRNQKENSVCEKCDGLGLISTGHRLDEWKFCEDCSHINMYTVKL